MSTQPVNQWQGAKEFIGSGSSSGGSNPYAQAAGLGIGLIGNYYFGKRNQKFQSDQNTRDRQFSWDMYWTQRNHALQDWAMENQYNSPEQQMVRLRQAGLSPHLVYGNGADATAQQIRQSSPGSGDQKAPQFDSSFVSPAMVSSMNMLNAQAQLDNLRAQNGLILAQIGKTIQDTDMSEFDLRQKDRLKDEAFQNAVNTNEWLRTQWQTNEHQDQRNAELHPLNLEKLANDILQQQLTRAKTEDERKEIQARIDNISTDTRLKELDEALKRKGIQPNDPMYARIIAQYLSGNADWEKLMQMLMRF